MTRASNISKFDLSVFKAYTQTAKETETDNKGTDKKTGSCEDKPNTLIYISLDTQITNGFNC